MYIHKGKLLPPFGERNYHIVIKADKYLLLEPEMSPFYWAICSHKIMEISSRLFYECPTKPRR